MASENELDELWKQLNTLREGFEEFKRLQIESFERLLAAVGMVKSSFEKVEVIVAAVQQQVDSISTTVALGADGLPLGSDTPRVTEEG